jgi:hypothetical protein
MIRIAASALVAISVSLPAWAQGDSIPPGDETIAYMQTQGVEAPAPAPDRPEGQGEGPFERMVIRGATLIDGTGAPPVGPVDIVIEGDRIASIRTVGAPGLAINPAARPAPGTHEIDATGMYVLPGFIDSHAHIGSPGQARAADALPPQYIFNLWMAHGVTTVREVGSLWGLGWTMSHRDRAARGEITAPRIYAYSYFNQGLENPEAARRWVRDIARRGADGIKFRGAAPDIGQAAIEAAAEYDLETAYHHDQRTVAGNNALDSARWGLTTMEHWYGLPEAMFDSQRLQDYPLDYNYSNEQDRFGEAGRLWRQAAEPGSERWNAVLEELIELDFTLVPTLTIYEANRDVMRSREAEWHSEYTHPDLWTFLQPDPRMHGSYFFDWTTQDEIDWRENYQIWMRFLDEYKDAGGRVAAGSDSGFIYNLYGFGYIRELELLQEAGFHPLEVIQAATLNGAEALGVADEIGSVEVGKRADLVIVAENPIENFKVLYGTGHERFNWETEESERVGGVQYTIRDGIVWDAPALLEDVRAMVEAAQSGE